MFGNGQAEKGVPLMDFPKRSAQNASGSLFEQITHRTAVDRLDDIRFITSRRKHEDFVDLAFRWLQWPVTHW